MISPFRKIRVSKSIGTVLGVLAGAALGAFVAAIVVPLTAVYLMLSAGNDPNAKEIVNNGDLIAAIFSFGVPALALGGLGYLKPFGFDALEKAIDELAPRGAAPAFDGN